MTELEKINKLTQIAKLAHYEMEEMLFFGDFQDNQVKNFQRVIASIHDTLKELGIND